MRISVPSVWTTGLDADTSVEVLLGLALRHATLGGVEGSRIETLLQSRNFAGLVAYELPLNQPGLNTQELYHCRQALAFFQKLEWLDVGIDKEKVAFEKFMQSEVSCREINTAFKELCRGRLFFRSRDMRPLLAARRKIQTVLGRCPRIEELDLGFGPGATTSIRKIEACPAEKMARGMQCSSTLVTSGLLPELLREVPHWSAALGNSQYGIDDEGWLYEVVPVDVEPGRLVFVAKNARTHRTIVVEPSLNGFLQQGIGRFIAKRLRAVGVDVDIKRDQTRNAALAKRGSIDDSIATIDLSSASDTIAKHLVEFLLGEEWYSLLCAARTSSVVYTDPSGTVFEFNNLEKMSSMGNGYTFPLETLIFWGITTAVCPSTARADIGVYGDDIICPAMFAPEVIRVLEFCGFSINSEKSFIQGPFRESCGKDYYLGTLIRPYYQKHLVSGQTLFTLHNFYARQSDYDGCRAVLKHIPRGLRIYGPDGYGDGHLVSENFPRLTSPKQLAKGYAGYSFETFTSMPRRFVNARHGDWVSPLYHIYRQGRDELSELSRNALDIWDKNRPSPRHLSVWDESVPRWKHRESCAELSFTRQLEFTRSGRPVWTLPGTDGYKSIRIYTLG